MQGGYLFKGRAHWLNIANALSDRSLTMAECARQLGAATSVIRRPLLAMVDAELVDPDSESLGRGTRFRLRPELIEQLQLELQDEQPRGKVLKDQVICVVECERLLDLANSLAAADLTRCVLWVAELDAGGRFLLVLNSRETSPTAHSRLRAAIEGGGGTCTPGRVGRVMGPEAWRDLLATTRDAAE